MIRTRREYAIAVAWRFGTFAVLSLGFPFLLVLFMSASNCGGGCGALALVAGIALKPIIVLVFVGSMCRITIARMRDVGLPGFIGLLVPLLLVVDWLFLSVIGLHWSVGFVLGGPPYFVLSALICMAFLCAISSGNAPASRFGTAGKLVLALTVAIAFVGLVVMFGGLTLGLMMLGAVTSGGLEFGMTMPSAVMRVAQFVPWAVFLQVVLFGYLIWQDRSRQSGTPHARPCGRITGPLVGSALGRRTA